MQSHTGELICANGKDGWFGPPISYDVCYKYLDRCMRIWHEHATGEDRGEDLESSGEEKGAAGAAQLPATAERSNVDAAEVVQAAPVQLLARQGKLLAGGTELRTSLGLLGDGEGAATCGVLLVLSDAGGCSAAGNRRGQEPEAGAQSFHLI